MNPYHTNLENIIVPLTALTTIVQNASSSWEESTFVQNNFLPLSGGTVTGKLILTNTISGNNLSVSFNQGSATGNYSFAVAKGKATGTHSYAEGVDAAALGYASHAEGWISLAQGDYSHVEGYGSWTGPNASGAHAEGNYTAAFGTSSHTEGSNTVASGTSSHAEGDNTAALGTSSHAEGNNTVASAAYGHTEGFKTRTGERVTAPYTASTRLFTFTPETSSKFSYVGPGDILPLAYIGGVKTFTVASRNSTTGSISATSDVFPANDTAYIITNTGTYSHAEGYHTEASGGSSHAEGNYTVAFGSSSHAEGEGSKTYGLGSHAEGGSTNAVGNYSHAEGFETVANGIRSHAAGARATAAHDNSWVWKGSMNTPNLSTTRTGQFIVSAAGGSALFGNVGIGTDSIANALTVVGTISTSNHGTSNDWNNSFNLANSYTTTNFLNLSGTATNSFNSPLSSSTNSILGKLLIQGDPSFDYGPVFVSGSLDTNLNGTYVITSGVSNNKPTFKNIASGAEIVWSFGPEGWYLGGKHYLVGNANEPVGSWANIPFVGSGSVVSTCSNSGDYNRKSLTVVGDISATGTIFSQNTLTTSICAVSGNGTTPFQMNFTNGLLTSITF